MPVDQADTMKIWHYRSVPTAPEPDIHVTSYDVEQVRAWLRTATTTSCIRHGDSVDPAEEMCVSFLSGYLNAALGAPDETIAEVIARDRRAQILVGQSPRQIEAKEP